MPPAFFFQLAGRPSAPTVSTAIWSPADSPDSPIAPAMEEAVTLASDPAGPRGPVSPLGPFRLARATTLSQFFPSPENWMYPLSTRMDETAGCSVR